MKALRYNPLVAALAAAALLAGCGGDARSGPSQAPNLTPGTVVRDGGVHRRGIATTPIAHIVIVVQENRSFDYLFQGYPGADTASTGQASDGSTITLQPISLATHYDINHGSKAFFAAYDDGKLDGFDRELMRGHGRSKDGQYGYAPASEVQPYTALAQQYVLADNMFSSQLDGSFTAHQYLIAAFAGNAINFPKGKWGCGPPAGQVHTILQNRTIGPREPACFTYPTLGSELDAAGVSWRSYSPSKRIKGSLWEGYAASNYVKFGQDWGTDIEQPETRFFTDLSGGNLAGVTWIIPRLGNSDHSGSKSTTGPQWVASIVNAIGQSQFWSSTAIFVVWDDWGGWYDHVAPPQLDYDGLGFRVPMLCISPYALQGAVSHVQYEHGSIVRFVEDTFGLPRMAASDARANSAADGCLNLSQAPRRFAPIPSRMGPRDFVRDARPDDGPDDE